MTTEGVDVDTRPVAEHPRSTPMPDTDTIPTNGHTRQQPADTGRVADDTGRVGKKSRTTLIDVAVLAAVDAEMGRLGWPGSRIDFLEQVILTGLQASASVQPINLAGQLSATIRPVGAK